MLHPIVINENGKRKTIYRPLFFPFGALRAWFKPPDVSGGNSARLAVAFNAAPCASFCRWFMLGLLCGWLRVGFGSWGFFRLIK